MPDAIMYQEDMFVVLEPGKAEVFLTPQELLERLQDLLADYPDPLPKDLQRFDTLTKQAQHLRDTACEFELEPGRMLQWYVVRLEK